MNEEKNGNANNGVPKNSPDKKESKLDQWIRQTLQIGSPKPETKIVHQPAPAVPAHKPQPQHTPKPQAASHPAHSTHPSHPVHPAHPAQHPQQGQHQKPQHPGHKPAHSAPRSATVSRPGGVHPGTKLSHPGSKPQHGGKPAHHDNKPKRGGFFFGKGPKTTPVVHGEVLAGTPARPVQQFMPLAANQRYQGKLRCIMLGGLDEVGKNSMALEYGNDIIIIDLGFQFPDEDMLGVDYIIPDTAYLDDKIDRIRGVIFTHGHLDHIGGVPYLMPKLNFPPLYGTRLTMGLVEKRLEEFGQMTQAKVNVITENDTLQLGPFNISFFAVNHSIPDAVGVVVKTPAGNIVHTGDFKFDHTPSGNQKPADFAKIASLAYQNIAALFIDSTNALKPGHTITEKRIGESLEGIIKNTEGRILIASFASQIGRLQQIIDAAKKHGRTIYLSGRSLIDNVFMAAKLGYLKVPEGMVHDIRKVKKIPDHKVLILTTGSQGEDVSALSRIALEEHPAVKIKKGDTVVLSSSPIPGNERAITTVTNNLCRLGASIINNQIMDVHTSGHAQQEDLKLMVSLVRPKYVVPVHGEYYMRYGMKEIAMGLSYDEKHSLLVENGDVLEIENNEVQYKGERVQNNYILIDGLGVGDIGAQVIMDRQTLAENGVLIVMVPVDVASQKLKGEVDVISRGFIYMSESEELIKGISEVAANAYRNIIEKRSDAKRPDIKKYLRESIDKFVHEKIERHPLVIPLIVER